MDRLNAAFETTLKALENGKEEIFNISETTRLEAQRLIKELGYLRTEIAETINNVDSQKKKEKQLRQDLMETSLNYKRYTEKQMMEVYIEAKNSQAELQLLMAKESELRNRRDELERTLKNLDVTVERAEKLLTQVSVAITLLNQGISEMNTQFNTDLRKEIALRITRIQDEERRRISREIHDGPAQSIANIILRLEIAEKLMDLDTNKAKKEIKEINNLVRSNLEDIRRIIFDLRPMNMVNTNFMDTIRNYIINYKKIYGIQAEFELSGDYINFNDSLSIPVYRIIQEGMINVAKHANSDVCKVFINFHQDKIEAKIVDFGKGFVPADFWNDPGEHFGLIGIRERIEMYSGQLSIVSSIGRGTEFSFVIPYSSVGGLNNENN
jgi:two-component system sensor histidine kinase DegS